MAGGTTAAAPPLAVPVPRLGDAVLPVASSSGLPLLPAVAPPLPVSQLLPLLGAPSCGNSPSLVCRITAGGRRSRVNADGGDASSGKKLNWLRGRVAALAVPPALPLVAGVAAEKRLAFGGLLLSGGAGQLASVDEPLESGAASGEETAFGATSHRDRYFTSMYEMPTSAILTRMSRSRSRLDGCLRGDTRSPHNDYTPHKVYTPRLGVSTPLLAHGREL